jgi:hypothetical protein
MPDYARGGYCRSSNSAAIGSLGERPETAAFVADQVSRPALLLVAQGRSRADGRRHAALHREQNCGRWGVRHRQDGILRGRTESEGVGDGGNGSHAG